MKIVITKFKNFYSIQLSNINITKFITFQIIVIKTFSRALLIDILVSLAIAVLCVLNGKHAVFDINVREFLTVWRHCGLTAISPNAVSPNNVNSYVHSDRIELHSFRM